MKEYARRGAEARIAELRAEMAEIYRAFPGLRRGRPAADAGDAGEETTGGTGAGRKRRGGKRGPKRPMSAAQKRAVSQRMKRWWAEQKKGKAAAK
jgi:hypothetical protein